MISHIYCLQIKHYLSPPFACFYICLFHTKQKSLFKLVYFTKELTPLMIKSINDFSFLGGYLENLERVVEIVVELVEPLGAKSDGETGVSSEHSERVLRLLFRVRTKIFTINYQAAHFPFSSFNPNSGKFVALP